jgi:GT2 family glycosyltransferase/nucleoside-diphosphate-sugar epimerase
MNRSVSIIIVNYNGGPLLAECVRSVLASHVPVEVIVSDNASTDTSLIELRLACGGDRRLRIRENPSNLGFAKANNRALALARYDFILFLNPDCIVQPDTLDRMLDLFEADSGIGMAGCLIRNPDGSEQPGCRRSIPTPWRTFVQISGLGRLRESDPRFRSYLHTGLPIPAKAESVEAISGAFMLVSRLALDQVGPMDEGYFMHFEDLDWCLRFEQAGWKVIFEPNVEIMHIGGVCSATRPMLVEYHKHRGMARFYRKFFRERHYLLLHVVLVPAILTRFLLRLMLLLLGRMGLYPQRESRRQASLVAGELSERFTEVSETGKRQRVIVTGATSLIGDYLLPGLLNSGYEVHAISRKPPSYGRMAGLRWHHVDITQQTPDIARDADVLIHLAPLATLPPLMAALARQCPKRVIGFGSTSVFTKMQSALEKERELASGLKEAEQRIAELSEEYGIQWTVFRPTLVYHLGRDKNVTTIAEFLRKFGFFPLVNGSPGRRQPVHAEDLAMATLAAVHNTRSFGKAYNLCGGETLTYREMVVRIAEAIGIRSRLIDIPLPVLRAFISLVAVIPRYRHVNPEMATRISLDMCFDNQAAIEDLKFSPRIFLGEPGTN